MHSIIRIFATYGDLEPIEPAQAVVVQGLTTTGVARPRAQPSLYVCPSITISSALQTIGWTTGFTEHGSIQDSRLRA